MEPKKDALSPSIRRKEERWGKEAKGNGERVLSTPKRCPKGDLLQTKKSALEKQHSCTPSWKRGKLTVITTTHVEHSIPPNNYGKKGKAHWQSRTGWFLRDKEGPDLLKGLILDVGGGGQFLAYEKNSRRRGIKKKRSRAVHVYARVKEARRLVETYSSRGEMRHGGLSRP